MTEDPRRPVTATLREDGTVYFEIQDPNKSTSERVLGWMLAALWCLAGAVLVAAILAM